MIYQGKARYPVREIVMHCSATRPEWMAGAGIADVVAEIRRWHVEGRGWRDIGYHYVADRDGVIARCRPESAIGAHVLGRNRGTIGICLIGGHGAASTDHFEDHFTPAQDRAARRLIAGISGRTSIRRISGHNEYAAKACPGFNVAEWLASKPQPAMRPLTFWERVRAAMEGRK